MVNANDRLERVKNAQVGTIVAFSADGKVKSAKIVRKSSEEQLLKVVTKYGAQRIVSYDDVVWVKTGARWPRWVYEALTSKNDDAYAHEGSF